MITIPMRVATRNEHDGPQDEQGVPTKLVQIVLAPAVSGTPGVQHFPLPIMSAAEAVGFSHGAAVEITVEVAS